ncbi:MAG: hypothetical protein K0R90_1082 [Oscillospiraceae bacterium]|nr:hypothetical protein [Oscillospiraceae bacterium]
MSLANNQKSEEKIYTSDPSDIENIRVNAHNTSVEVIQTEDEEISIQYYESQNRKYSVSSQNHQLVLKQEYYKMFNIDFFSFSEIGTNITVKVPKNYKNRIEIETSNSSIYAEDIKSTNNLIFKTSNSKIELRGIVADDLTVTTSNGKITLFDVEGSSSVNAKTSNGKIELDNVKSEDIKLKSSNGSIVGSVVGNEDDYRINADTSNASNNLTNRYDGKYSLSAETSNARIDIDFTNPF